MSFERPPLTEIIRRTVSDFEYELGSQAPRLPGTVEHAFVRAGAGVAHGLHGRIDRVRRDAFWATSSDEELIRKAALFGVFHIPATRASGFIIAPASVLNAPLPAGTIFARDDGTLYETTTTVLAEGFNAVAPARALLSGAAGNMPIGTTLTLQSPVAGFFGSGTAELVPDPADAQWATGADAESTASLRRRLALRLASPPKGGGPGDYIRWALGGSDADKVPAGATPPVGVTRAWEYGKVPKIGNVTVLIMCDDDEDPFPSPAKLAEVKEWIMLFAPIALPEPIVLAPNPKVLNIVFSALTLDNDADITVVKAAIVESLRNMIAVRATPPKDGTAKFYKSWLNEAISKTPGEVDHKISTPAGDLSLAQWDLVRLGTVTWP